MEGHGHEVLPTLVAIRGAGLLVDQAASLQALQMEFPVREIDWADVLYLLYRSVRITPQTQRE
jgi:hypothetical protein